MQKIVQKRKSNYNLLHGSDVKSLYVVIIMLKLTWAKPTSDIIIRRWEEYTYVLGSEKKERGLHILYWWINGYCLKLKNQEVAIMHIYI